MGILKRMFLPDLYINDIYKLDIENIKKLNIKAFIFDIDNTIVTYDDITAPEKTVKWFDFLHQNGIKTYIVSNNKKERVEVFSKSINEPYYYKALKPRKKYLKLALDELNVKSNEAALIGDQLFTDIYGGKRMKMYTILTKPISDKEDSFVHFKRKLERVILHTIGFNKIFEKELKND